MNKRNIYYLLGVLILIAVVWINGGKDKTNTNTTTDTQDSGEVKSEQTKTSDSSDNSGSGQTSSTYSIKGPSQEEESNTPPPRLNLPRGTTPPPQIPPQKVFDVHDGLTFQEAMAMFGNYGYRYQFVECHGNPGGFVIKQATKFMLDNRDSRQHQFVVATQNFLIPGYDFVITSSKDIGTYMITCDGGGAAQLTVVP